MTRLPTRLKENYFTAEPNCGSLLGGELSQLLDGFFGEPRGFQGTLFSPTIDVVEDEDNYLVTVEVPGSRKGDVRVFLREGVLTIEGEKKEAKDTKKEEMAYSERVYGKFQRYLKLGKDVDPKKIDAQFKDGVLAIKLPKAEESKPKEIDIKIS